MMEDLEQLKVLENGYKIKARPPRCVTACLLLACLSACPLPTSRLPACPTVTSVPTFGVVWLLLDVSAPFGFAAHAPAAQRPVPPCLCHAVHAAHAVQVVVVDHSAHGVDMPEDVASIEAIMRAHHLQ